MKINYILLVLLLTGCKKCSECKKSETNGDIVSLYYIPSCYDGKIEIGEYYIRDTVSLVKLLKTYPNYASNCDTNILNVDFSKYTLLGKYVSDNGCKEKFIRNVIIDNNEKTVKYSIYSCSKGTCAKKLGSYNFVLIPKFPNDYRVSFETKRY